MIYLDSSIALAQILAEPQRVPDRLWDETLVSSRLLAYEVWNRIHVQGDTRLHDAAHELIGRVSFSTSILLVSPARSSRSRSPFPRSTLCI